jgi:long-chain acyl-CoA synthetase
MSELTKDVIGLAASETLDGLFRERVRRSPQRPAYRAFDRAAGGWRELSWADMAAEVGRWQAAMRAEGLVAGDRVAIALRNGPDWVAFDQAALGLGLVVVPLYPEDRPDNLAYILADCGARLVLLQDGSAWRRLAPALGDAPELARVVLLGAGRGSAEPGVADPRARLAGDWLSAGAHRPAARSGDGEALATIVYTSGTTGRPKGVMLSHRNILAVTDAVLRVIDCYQDDLFLSFLPLSHTLERTGGYYLPMMAGACVAYARSIQQLAEDLQQVRPSVMIAVPRVFERFYARIQQQLHKQGRLSRGLFELTVTVGWRRFQRAHGRAGWSADLLLWPVLRRLVADRVVGRLGGRLRIAVSGGAALATPVARVFVGLGLRILQGYGLTETSPVISVNTLEDNDPASVGPPLPGIELRLDEAGELRVRGPGVMMGYWRDPEATRAVLDADGWLRTGDKVEVREGRLYITGRLKDILVLSNGENVPPGEMEGAIALDELFDHVMVVGEGRPFLSAVLVLNPEGWQALARQRGLDPADPGALEDERLVAAVLGRVDDRLVGFPGYAKVRRVLLSLEPWTVDNGLLTPTLKFKRARVLERFQERLDQIYREGPTGVRRRAA